KNGNKQSPGCEPGRLVWVQVCLQIKRRYHCYKRRNGHLLRHQGPLQNLQLGNEIQTIFQLPSEFRASIANIEAFRPPSENSLLNSAFGVCFSSASKSANCCLLKRMFKVNDATPTERCVGETSIFTDEISILLRFFPSGSKRLISLASSNPT